MRTPLNMGRVHAILIWTAFAWAIWNAFFVYVVLGGAQSFRMEAAVFILAALLLPLSWSSASAGSTPRDISVNQARLVIAAAVLTWAVILLPLAGTPLLSEDYGFVERYRSLRDVFGKWQFFRPAFAAVFVILNGAGGGSPLPFHLVSLTLHLTSAWLVQSLVLRLFQSPMLAALTCAVFLLHSVQLEAVLWTAAMQDLLWTVFMLGALRVYAGGRALSGWRIASTSFLLLLSLLSKETAVCAVFLIPALDWRLQRLKAAQRAYVTFGLLLLAYLIVRVSVADVASGVPSALTQYALKQFLSIPYRVFSHPWSSAGPAPPGGVAFGIAAALLALLLSAAWKLGGRLLIGPAVIAISTVPLVQYLWVTPELHNARYLYFPAIGWAFLMAQLAVCSARDPKWQLLTGSAITLFSAACLVWNTPPWRLAAQLVEAMAVEVAAGGDGRAAAAAWQARAGVTVEMRDGIPVSSQGVDILRNSHEEFVAYYRQRRMTHSGADATR